MSLLIHFPPWEMKDVAMHLRTDYFTNFQGAEISLKLKCLLIGFRNLERCERMLLSSSTYISINSSFLSLSVCSEMCNYICICSMVKVCKFSKLSVIKA